MLLVKNGQPSLWDNVEKEDKIKQAPKTKHKKIKNSNPDAKKIE